MVERVSEVEETVVEDETPVRATRRVTTATDSDTRTVVADRAGTDIVERIIYYITGVLLTLLAFRFVLSLLGANRANPFADFIFGVTYPFVAPFFGLFGYSVQYGVARFEVETLVAMAVYALLAYGIVKLIRIFRHAD